MFVLASRHEGLSVALSEAMAAGLPAVVTDVGELIDALVQDGLNGYTYAVGDVTALTALLRRLLEDPDHARNLGEAAAGTRPQARRCRTDLRPVRGDPPATQLGRRAKGSGRISDDRLPGPHISRHHCACAD